MMDVLIVKLANGQVVAKGNVYSSLSVAHWRITHAFGPINPEVRYASRDEEAFWNASLSNRTAKVVSSMVPEPTGFFVDWDGVVRRFESPGDGFRCIYAFSKSPSVEVLDSSGCVVFEATYYSSLDQISRFVKSGNSSRGVGLNFI